ncbi:glycoside hydrolase family 32 protein [Robertmurraya sp. GLU-23]
MNRLQKANDYIKENKHKTNNRPLFHFSPEIGWLNDPNGFSFYKGKYHLFYQYYPYDIVWNDMHWGHATTNDFVNWEYLPVAMANDKAYDANGCFSGSAIEKDGKLYLIYTGHIDPNLGFDKDESQIAERQCVAVSEDGIHFEKSKLNPVIGEKELPEGYLICDFRDPKVLERDGVYYCVLAVRNAKRRGEIIMFQSKDLLQWSFHSSIFQMSFEENTLLECPDLFHLDGKDVLIFSEMPCDPEFDGEVEKKTSYVIGHMDFENGVFTPEAKGLLDYSTFYAPQTTDGQNGERLLIGWMHRWTKATPPKEYGYNGMMSLPRKLHIKNNILIQQAYISHDDYFTPVVSHEHVSLNEDLHIESGRTGYLSLSLLSKSESFVVELNKENKKATRVSVDPSSNSVVITSDYGDSEPITVHDCFNSEENTLEFYVDLHSVEIFVNKGEKVVTFTAYEKEKGTSIVLSGKGAQLKEVRYEAFCS